MKIEELRNLPKLELQKLLEDKKEALFNLRFQLAKKTLTNYSVISTTKRDIARINTLLTQLQQNEEKAITQKPKQEAKNGNRKKS